MLNINIITNAGSNRIAASVDETPSQILKDNSISFAGATVSLNSRPLSYDDFDRTFAQLNCVANSTVILSVIVKADSAC